MHAVQDWSSGHTGNVSIRVRVGFRVRVGVRVRIRDGMDHPVKQVSVRIYR